MTITELQIQFDLNPDNRVNILKNVDTCIRISIGYLFVDQEDGQCYLFDKKGNIDDISKVKIIETCAFEGYTSLTNIKIPNLVKRIGEWAFDSCISLASIKISDNVKTIRSWAFEGCTSLTSIEIPNSIEYIGNEVFKDCASLKQVIFEGKTINQVKAMNCYPWGIEDTSIIKTKS